MYTQLMKKNGIGKMIFSFLFMLFMPFAMAIRNVGEGSGASEDDKLIATIEKKFVKNSSSYPMTEERALLLRKSLQRSTMNLKPG
jgi:hypothetical protein